MIKILKWSENRFIPAEKIEKHCLINIINPEKSELEKLLSDVLLPHDFITDPLDVDERARI
jgi:magnesium transporter